MLKKFALPLGAVALVALGGLWMTTQQQPALQPLGELLASPANAQEQAEAGAQDVPDMTLGAEDAPITVIEYASFTCPHCADFHDRVFGPLKADYIDTGKLRFVFREVYFDRPGLWAGLVARCGGEMRYFAITDMIFDRQREWIGDGDAATIAANLRKIGKAAGLSDAELETCTTDADMAQAMIDTYQSHLEEHDISGTPSLVIDGVLYGNMSYDDLKEILDAKLAN